MESNAVDDFTAGFAPVIDEICAYDYASLTADELSLVAFAYHAFSIQFRENLHVTLKLYPDDPQLQKLLHAECATANLSPWPGVAAPDEAMDHDAFMARVLTLSPIDPQTRERVVSASQDYLERVRNVDDVTKAMSIASYENGGLEAVFTAFLAARQWDTPLLQGFRHFLVKHIEFDSDPTEGHGALCRSLVPDDRIRPLWSAFRDLLLEAVPTLGVRTARY
jgi:hypothetical protein